MPRVSPIQSDFSGGEISPMLVARVDEKYAKSVALCQNWIPTEQGQLQRRPGTAFVSDKNPNTSTAWASVRLFPFLTVSQTGASPVSFVLALDVSVTPNQLVAYEASFATGAAIGTVVNTSSAAGNNFVSTDLPYIQTAQTSDTIYFVAPGKAPQKYSQTTGVFGPVTFVDGPYLPTNTTATTVTPNSVNATSMSSAGAVWASTDVGRHFRFRERWYTITSFTNTGLVGVSAGTGSTALPDTTASTDWLFGLFTTTSGGSYPGAIAFHEGRMLLGAYQRTSANRIDGSTAANAEQFAPSTINSTTVTDNEAYSFNLAASDGAVLRWFLTDERGVLVGSETAEFLVTGDAATTGISPLNVNVKQVTAHGSAKGVPPVKLAKSIMFVQPSRKKIRDLGYFFDVSGYVGFDVTLNADHVASASIVRLAAQKEMQQIVWACLADGSLIGVTYTRNGNQVLAAWHRHKLGGKSDAAGTAPFVEDVVCAPDITDSSLANSDGRDVLWMVVRRLVNGSTVRWLEKLQYFWDATTHQRFAIYVDGASGIVTAKTITAASTGTGTITFTSAAHGNSVGDNVTITDVVGLTFVNDRAYTITAVTTNTFTVGGWSGTGTYISGGKALTHYSSIGGVTRLAGETISIYADGAAQTNVTVDGTGLITFAKEAGYVTFGLPYQSDLQLLPFQAGAADGTSFGKVRRISRVALGLFRTLGVKIGTSFSKLTQLVFSKTNDNNYMPSLFTGTKVDTIDADYDTENQLCIRVDQPLPAVITAVAPQQTTQDLG